MGVQESVHYDGSGNGIQEFLQSTYGHLVEPSAWIFVTFPEITDLRRTIFTSQRKVWGEYIVSIYVKGKDGDPWMTFDFSLTEDKLFRQVPGRYPPV